MSTVIARQVTKAVVPLIIMVSINFFLQGHNRPGGGFIAGVMTSTALALLYVVMNFEGVEKLRGKSETEKYGLLSRYLNTVGSGVGLAAGTGLAMMALGLSFLNHQFGKVHIPVFGEIHWTTAVLFDLGVYLAVVGSAMTIIEVLGEE